MLTDAVKNHIFALAKRKVAPKTGMEIHFVQVVQKKALACSPEEKEWYAYWRSCSDSADSVAEYNPSPRTRTDGIFPNSQDVKVDGQVSHRPGVKVDDDGCDDGCIFPF